MRLDQGPVRSLLAIPPRRFLELIADKDPKKVQAVMDAMMTMVKLDVSALESAYDAA